MRLWARRASVSRFPKSTHPMRRSGSRSPDRNCIRRPWWNPLRWPVSRRRSRAQNQSCRQGLSRVVFCPMPSWRPPSMPPRPMADIFQGIGRSRKISWRSRPAPMMHQTRCAIGPGFSAATARDAEKDVRSAASSSTTGCRDAVRRCGFRNPKPSCRMRSGTGPTWAAHRLTFDCLENGSRMK